MTYQNSSQREYRIRTIGLLFLILGIIVGPSGMALSVYNLITARTFGIAPFWMCSVGSLLSAIAAAILVHSDKDEVLRRNKKYFKIYLVAFVITTSLAIYFTIHGIKNYY